ncbi:MAG: TonB-dependent receptor [Ideonella sp.]|nr:TonB-dependent receptor [Ideonella sp.]
MTSALTHFRRCAWQGLVLLGGAAQAQTVAPPDAPASAPTAAPAAQKTDGKPAAQRVEISGTVDSNTDRRRSTAAKVIYGREEIDRMGDSTLGEVLKRLPGVTMGGPPGRGGNPSMRGMGGGYTAILIDGQRMPFGFSLDSIAPEQIERIEIMRAPVAEHGARAIAGIINVVMREDFKRKANEFRFGGGVEDGDRPQFGANWNTSGQNDALGYNLSAALTRQNHGDESFGHTVGTEADGRTSLEQFSHNLSRSRREGVFLNGRLQFRLGQGNTLDLQPFANLSRSRSSGHATLDQPIGFPPAAFASADYNTSGDTNMGRLNGTWVRTLDSGGRLQLRFGTSLAQSNSLTQRQEYASGGPLVREKVDDGSVRDLSVDMNGKFSQLIADRHSMSAGWEVQGGRRSDQRITTENGLPTLTEFGDTLEARTLRLAAYAQDEWEWSKTFSFYAGLRWEGIQTKSDSLGQNVSNLSSVLTPLGHMVWKLPDAPRDQVRLSLTRSYKSPTTAQLIARPSISNLYSDTSKPNLAVSPDRAGNPELKPELAWGLDLAFEHYLDAGGIVSANVFARSIDNLIRTVRAEEAVSWASVPRWVARPQNIGKALAGGLELEAKLRASDLWDTDWPITLRTNGSLLWSRVDGVPGPNNRLDQQPRYTANFGFDWPLRGTPITLGSNLNFTPSYVVQQIDSQIYRQGVKRVIDGYALWRFGTEASARLSFTNASARDYETGTTMLLPDGSAYAQDTLARTYTTVTLRFELRF